MEDTVIRRGDGHVIHYRDIPALPGYRAGSDGSVWSFRDRAGELTAECHRLAAHRRPYGARYCMVCIRPTPGGKVVCRYVHRLVLETFVGPCPEGMVCCHGDGDTANNALGNLRWDTQRGNLADRERHGTLRRGTRSPLAKHDEMDALTVHLLRRIGFTQRAIGQLLAFSQPDVGKILRGKSWRHVRRAYRALSCLLKSLR